MCHKNKRKPAFSLFLPQRASLTSTFILLSCLLLNVKVARALPATRAEDPRVLLLYVDGLRPDTVDAMVAEGKLPNMQELFYARGVRFENFFTTFPSNTVIANGVFMTGKEPCETGIKSQAFFERFRTHKKHWFEWLWPWAGGKYPRQTNLLANPEKTPGLLRRSRTRALYHYLGQGYHATVVPISRFPAPIAWPHVTGNIVHNVWHVTEDAAKDIDKINGAYALNYMTTDTKAQVFLVWFPGIDKDQHHDPNGQYGTARQRLVDADIWLGKMVALLAEKYPNLYVMLFSDHGAIGGEKGVYNQQFYLGRDFFYNTLKMNVLGPDYSITHPGTNPDSFVYVDNMGRGQAKIYLPVKDSTSANWRRPNTFYEITHYGLGPNRAPVNLIERLASLRLDQQNAFPEATPPFPVDLIFAKISPELIYARSTQRGEALIYIQETGGRQQYRYVPIQRFSQEADGALRYEETSSDDAFGYLNNPAFAGGDALAFLKDFHNAQDWLKASYKTAYPDAVPAIARLLTWNAHLEKAASAQDPDIVLSAMPGWNFRIEELPSADHGFIACDSMRATLMMHGPGIQEGARIETPYRIASLAPTIFDMIRYPKKTGFDEEPIREIYQS